MSFCIYCELHVRSAPGLDELLYNEGVNIIHHANLKDIVLFIVKHVAKNIFNFGSSSFKCQQEHPKNIEIQAH